MQAFNNFQNTHKRIQRIVRWPLILFLTIGCAHKLPANAAGKKPSIKSQETSDRSNDLVTVVNQNTITMTGSWELKISNSSTKLVSYLPNGLFLILSIEKEEPVSFSYGMYHNIEKYYREYSLINGSVVSSPIKTIDIKSQLRITDEDGFATKWTPSALQGTKLARQLVQKSCKQKSLECLFTQSNELFIKKLRQVFASAYKRNKKTKMGQAH